MIKLKLIKSSKNCQKFIKYSKLTLFQTLVTINIEQITQNKIRQFKWCFQQNEVEFLAKLNSELALSASYEDPAAQAAARSAVPVPML
jgi:hypothetical protein